MGTTLKGWRTWTRWSHRTDSVGTSMNAFEMAGRILGLALGGALLATSLVDPSGLAAQEPAYPSPMDGLSEECTLEDFRVIRSQEAGPGDRVTNVGEPDLSCPDGTRIQADSAILYEAMGLTRLMGNVRYDSPDRSLRSHDADYYEHNRRLFAEGEVEFVDHLRGVRLFGDELDYLSAYEDRPEERISVRGDRPRALIPPDGPDGEPDLQAEPWEVEGDHLQFEGEQHFWADGDARLTREDVEATGQTLTFDQTSGELTLEEEARLLAPDYDLSGHRIVLVMPGDEIQEAQATGEARLAGEAYDLLGDTLYVHPPDEEGRREVHSFVEAELLHPDLNIAGDEVRVFLVNEELERLVARRAGEPAEVEEADEAEPLEERDARGEFAEEILRAEDEGVGEDEEQEEPQERIQDDRARVTTADFEMRADSVSISAPGQVLERLVGVGRARGETLGREAPGWDDAPEFLRQDFMEGDTVTAYFDPVPEPEVAASPEASSTPSDGQEETPSAERDAREYVLEALEAQGNARTLYRMPPGVRSPGEEPEEPQDPDEPPPDGGNASGDPAASGNGGGGSGRMTPSSGNGFPTNEASRWGVSYVLADRIWIGMLEGEVDRMEARGNVDGVHLEPRAPEEDPEDPDGDPGDEDPDTDSGGTP